MRKIRLDLLSLNNILNVNDKIWKFTRTWAAQCTQHFTSTFNGTNVTNAYLDTLFSPYFTAGNSNICDKDGNLILISDGFNGTPKGFANDCEDANGNTNWYVLHAEANAMLKVAKSTQNTEGSTLYVTYSPCKDCSKLIIQSGIKRVIYKEEYRDISGVKILREANIDVIHLGI